MQRLSVWKQGPLHAHFINKLRVARVIVPLSLSHLLMFFSSFGIIFWVEVDKEGTAKAPWSHKGNLCDKTEHTRLAKQRKLGTCSTASKGSSLPA